MPRKPRPNEVERIARAERAAEVLENPAYIEAHAEIEAKLTEQATAPEKFVKKVDRDHAYYMLQACRAFQLTLARFLKTGEIDVMNRDRRQEAANGGAAEPTDD